MKIKFYLAWYDLWIGIYISRAERKIYICPFFCCVLEISLPRRDDSKIYGNGYLEGSKNYHEMRKQRFRDFYSRPFTKWLKKKKF